VSYLLNALYLLLLLLASPWLLWQAWRKGKYRAGFAEKFLGRVPRRIGDAPAIWLHAVSVGEVSLLAPLVRALERARPDCELLISTTSVAGYQLAQQKYATRTVFYCPLDFSWAVRTALRRLRPNLLVLAELELWPNLIRGADKAGVAVAVVNGRLSERSFRGYRRLRWFAASLLRRLACVAVQNEAYAARFEQLGAPRARLHVTGSLKFDGANPNRDNRATMALRELAGVQPTDQIFLAGSTQEPEEQRAIETFRALAVDQPRLRMILVPRHPERFAEVGRLLDRSGLAWRRRSELAHGARSCSQPLSPSVREAQAAGALLPCCASWQVLLVDTIGELGAWWGAASIAFVGGSLGTRGGQNMIEPAAYGAAVCFGPNTHNFRDIVRALREAQGAVVVQDGAELTAFVRRCLTEPAFAAALGQNAASLVRENLGATARTMVHLLPLLPAAGSKSRQAA
jgi:3-deoxy-D-manno-octulosonic-acid transferase